MTQVTDPAPPQDPTPPDEPTIPDEPTVPDVPAIPDVPPGGVIYGFWNVGSWSGTGTCGQPSTLTRNVSCNVIIGDANSQLVFNGLGPDRVCLNDPLFGGPKPAASYSGSDAGCTYAFGPGEYGPWSNTCGSGTRTAPSVCLRNGVPIDDKGLCLDPPGGTQSYDPGQYTQWGSDYSGCNYAWDYGNGRIGNCTGGTRDVDYPNRICRRYNTTGNLVGNVDASYCPAYAPIATPCDSSPHPAEPGSLEELSCVTGASPALSVSAVVPGSFYNTDNEMIADVCSARSPVHGTACCTVMHYPDGRVSVSSWAPGVSNGMTCMEYALDIAQRNHFGPESIPTDCTVTVEEKP